MATVVCNSFKQECMQGIHVLGTDTLKGALFVAAAALGASTTVYSATNELSGGGYPAGGVTVTIQAGPTLSGSTAYVDFNDATFTALTTTVARYMLVYNFSKSNKAICVFDFTTDQSSGGGDFVVQLQASPGNLQLT